MRSGDGKGARVAGFFLFLLGAGIVLDTAVDLPGAVLATCGGALLAFGLLRRRPPVPSLEANAKGGQTC